MIYIEVAEQYEKRRQFISTILSTLAANAAMFACEINFNDAEAACRNIAMYHLLGFMVFLIGIWYSVLSE